MANITDVGKIIIGQEIILFAYMKAYRFRSHFKFVNYHCLIEAMTPNDVVQTIELLGPFFKKSRCACLSIRCKTSYLHQPGLNRPGFLYPCSAGETHVLYEQGFYVPALDFVHQAGKAWPVPSCTAVPIIGEVGRVG